MKEGRLENWDKVDFYSPTIDETRKEICVIIGGDEWWLPKSKITIHRLESGKVRVVVPVGLVR